MTQLTSWANRLANLPDYDPQFNQFAWVMFYKRSTDQKTR